MKFHFFHFGCCNLPFLHFSFWFLPVKTLKKYSEYSEHLFEYSNIIRLFKMGRIRIRIVLFGKKYSNIRIIRIFVSTLSQIFKLQTKKLLIGQQSGIQLCLISLTMKMSMHVNFTRQYPTTSHSYQHGYFK